MLGTVLGVFTAIVLSLQSALFTNLPFYFSFPTGLFFLVVCVAILVAVIGSYFPLQKLRHQHIAETLKM